MTSLETEAAPACPECATALHPAGGGRHRYWSCRYCGDLRPFDQRAPRPAGAVGSA